MDHTLLPKQDMNMFQPVEYFFHLEIEDIVYKENVLWPKGNIEPHMW